MCLSGQNCHVLWKLYTQSFQLCTLLGEYVAASRQNTLFKVQSLQMAQSLFPWRCLTYSKNRLLESPCVLKFHFDSCTNVPLQQGYFNRVFHWLRTTHFCSCLKHLLQQIMPSSKAFEAFWMQSDYYIFPMIAAIETQLVITCLHIHHFWKRLINSDSACRAHADWAPRCISLWECEWQSSCTDFHASISCFGLFGLTLCTSDSGTG